MFPIVFLLAFVIDVSHWFDYSRNLQNRADAAALAGSETFGNICLGGGNPGDTTSGVQSAIGKWAQLYSGAGVGEPLGRLPYTDAAVSASPTNAAANGGPGTGWKVTTNGYINNTLPPSPVVSRLTLKAGSLNDYWLVLNGKDYAENGGTSFSMMPSGTGATLCNSDPTQDLTDPSRATAGPAGPMVDVKVSQRGLPLFFPLIGFRPTIHAHARVQLQGESSSPSEPIAVSDTGFTPCVSVDFIDASTNTVIKTAVLKQETQVNPTDPITWDNVLAPASITMPASANVYLRPFLNNCNGSGQQYDGDTNTGVLYINSHPATNPTVGANDPPALTPGGVFLSGTSCAPNQYFAVATGGCTDTIEAYVEFDPGLTPASKTKVFAVDHFYDNVNQVFKTGSPISLTQDRSDPTHWTGSLSVPDQSGMHQIEITWEQNTGTITGIGNCDNTPSNPCTGTFGIQQQAFGACNGCDQPDDSGPIVSAQLSEGTSSNVNSLAQNSTHNLVVTLKLAGLFSAQPTDPPIILRFPVSGNHQTGLVDCGQGNNGNWDGYVVYGGCGPGNPFIGNPLPPLNPLYVNARNGDCTGAPNTWPSGNHQDCVKTTPGTRRQNIICPLVLRITGQPFNPNSNCNNNSVGTCPDNNWPTVGGGDPRALTMIITSAVDLAAADNSPQFWIPVRRFATFYVTGWDSTIKPQCAGNDPFPGTGKKNNQNAAVWGHWMNYVDAAGLGNNQNCPTNSVQPINCVPVLTR